MKKRLSLLLIAGMALAYLSGTALATAPGQTVNPNGFPSGPHYNLNIIGKKADFTCPAQAYDESGNPIYGNAIYVPQNGTDIQILMQSGRKGGRAEAIPELQVLDPCSGFDGNSALLRLPPNENGYRVYARALAKPTDDPSISIEPQLVAVEDESGNDLIYLGLVTGNGFETPNATFFRNRGKSTAVDITGLFEWTGTVCYFQEPEQYQSTLDLCCLDADLNGVYEDCEALVVDPVTSLTTCPEGYTQLAAYCTEYVNEWVFNIGDFVTYLWNTDNNGVKLLQVRFYPVVP